MHMHTHICIHMHMNTWMHVQTHAQRHFSQVLFSPLPSHLTQTHAVIEGQALTKREKGQEDQVSESSVDEEMEEEMEAENEVKVNSNKDVKKKAFAWASERK